MNWEKELRKARAERARLGYVECPNACHGFGVCSEAENGKKHPSSPDKGRP